MEASGLLYFRDVHGRDVGDAVPYRVLICLRAGFSRTAPSSPNREPWQGQSQLCSALFQFRAQPKWVQRGTVGRRI